MNRILIVEDDKSISDAVALNMQFVGYEYMVFNDGKKAAEYGMLSRRTMACG